MGRAELGVILQDLGGEFDLRLGLGDELAHLEGENFSVLAGVLAQGVRGALHEGGAFVDGNLAPALESLVGSGQRGLNLLRGGGLEGFDYFTGIRVCGLESHENSSLLTHFTPFVGQYMPLYQIFKIKVSQRGFGL